MNLALHHFRKEFRYLHLRWIGYLALLAFELMVNLEWLLPMQAGVPSPGWLTYLPILVLLAGLSLLVTCPEDRPGSDRSFFSTRPLPLSAYWIARIMIWLLLILLPAVLQNGLYLALSNRPGYEVWRGMGQTFALAAGFTAWMIPVLVLWRWRELLKFVLILFPTIFIASQLLDLTSPNYPKLSAQQTPSMLALGWALFALLSVLIARRHVVKHFSFQKRATLSLCAAVLCLAVARLGSQGDIMPLPLNQDLVDQHAPQLELDFALGEARFEGLERSFGPSLQGKAIAETGMERTHVVVHPTGSTFTQGEVDRRIENPESSAFQFLFQPPQDEVHRGNHHLSEFFPKGTLLMTADEYFPKWTRHDQPLDSMAVFSEPHLDFDQPLQVETEFLLEWFQRDIAISIPLAEGARGECDELRWEILRLSPAEGPNPGSLTLTLHQESRSHWEPQNGHAVLLHLPDKKLVRLEPAAQSVPSERGEHTGWSRSIREFTWEHIFHHKEGEVTGVDLTDAKILLLRSRYLGRSHKSWKSPEFCLSDIPSHWGSDLNWNSADALYQGREKKAFQDRLATLTPPTAESDEKEVRRYVYDLFSAASRTRAVYAYGAHPLIKEAFEPLGQHHLPLMLEFRSLNWPGWSNRPPNSLVEGFVTDAHRESLIERAPENKKIAHLVVQKGWADEAKHHKRRLLSYPILLPGAEHLLIEWIEDPEVANRLLEEAKHDFQGFIISALDENPETKSQAEAIVRKQYEETLLLLGSTNSISRVQRAANFGSEDAFEICLRWHGVANDTPRAYAPHPHILKPDGSRWSYSMPNHERGPFFRNLKVSDFEYVPEKRAWRFLTL